MEIRKASRKQSKLKIGLFGLAGSGKTMSALKLARGLTDSWDKICVIDTEIISPHQSSADLYSDLGDFNVMRLDPPYDPTRYVYALSQAEKAGMDVIIIDSISQEWEGKGGCLEQASAYSDWKKVGPKHTEFIERIKSANAHVICCGRVKIKTETVESDAKGKKSYEVKKLGIGVISREGFDYEMFTAFDLDHRSHLALTTKDRTGLFMDRAPFLIDEKLGEEFIAWSNSGEELKPDDSEAKEIEGLKAKIIEIMAQKGFSKADCKKITGLETLEGQSLGVYVTAIEKLVGDVSQFQILQAIGAIDGGEK